MRLSVNFWITGQSPVSYTHLDVYKRQLHRFAVEKNATNAQISLAWMLHKYPNVVPIPGSKNQERILENLGAWNVTLSGDEFRQLQSALDECKVHGHRGCVETEQTSFGKQWSEETAK